MEIFYFKIQFLIFPFLKYNFQQISLIWNSIFNKFRLFVVQFLTNFDFLKSNFWQISPFWNSIIIKFRHFEIQFPAKFAFFKMYNFCEFRGFEVWDFLSHLQTLCNHPISPSRLPVIQAGMGSLALIFFNGKGERAKKESLKDLFFYFQANRTSSSSIQGDGKNRPLRP